MSFRTPVFRVCVVLCLSAAVLVASWSGVTHAFAGAAGYFGPATTPPAEEPIAHDAPVQPNALSGSVYTWNQTGTAAFATAANWTPARTTPAATDILVFSNGAVTTATGVTTQTIGQLIVSANTAVNLQGASTLTIAGDAGTDLDVQTGSALNCNTAGAVTIAVASGATAGIGGSITFTSAAHRLTGVDAGSVVFAAGSNFTAGTSFSGSAFGTTNLNSVVFASGSTYTQFAGANPFGAAAPNSVTVFQTGSLYKITGSGSPAFSGRTYSNVEFAGTGAYSVSGSSAVVIDDLTVTSGTVAFNMTGSPGHAVKGDISVASAAALNFSPSTSLVLNLSGTSVQAISGSGTFNPNSNTVIQITNPSGVTLQRAITTAGEFNVMAGGRLDCGANVVSGGSSSGVTVAAGATLGIGSPEGISQTGTSGNIQTVGRAFNSGANYVYNGASPQAAGKGLPLSVNSLTVDNTAGLTLGSRNLTLNGPSYINGGAKLTVRTTTPGDAAAFLIAAGTLTNNGSLDVFDYFQINQGGSAAGNAVFYEPSGTLVFNNSSGILNVNDEAYWPAVNGPRNVLVQTGGGIRMNVSRTVDSFFGYKSGVFNANRLTLNGISRVLNGGSVSGSPTYGPSSRLEYAVSGPYGRNGEWLPGAAGGPGSPHDVYIQDTTLDLANGSSSLPFYISGNLNVDYNGKLDMAGATPMTAALNIGGDVTIQNSAGMPFSGGILQLSTAAGGDLNVGGSWSLVYSPDGLDQPKFIPNGRTVTFNGTGTQTIYGGTSFFDLAKVSNTPGQVLKFQAAGTTTVTNSLTLSGSAGNPLTLRSTSPGTAWELNAPATYSVGYVDVQDSDAGLGALITAANSVDSGNNTNWAFPAAAQPGSIEFSSASYSQSESGSIATITLQRTGGSDGAVSVDYTLADGTAAGGACGPGIDYSNPGAAVTVNFADGQASQSFSVTLCGDNLYEPGDPETVSLSLGNPQGGAALGPQTSATLSISDSDTQPMLQFANASSSVNEAATTATISVSRTGATENAVSVNYSTSDGGAHGGTGTCAAGDDFLQSSGTLNFAAGELSKSFNITICDDDLFESDETVNVSLGSFTGAGEGTQWTAVLTITDTDVQPSLQFSTSTYSEDETQTLEVKVTRTGAAGGVSAVDVSTGGGDAVGGAACTAGVDYVSVSITGLTFAAGETEKAFGVEICTDKAAETVETFGITLSNADAGSVLGPPSAAVVTVNDAAGEYRQKDGIAAGSGSQIEVSGAASAVGNVRVTLYDVSAGFAGDVDVLLVGPQGQSLILMSDAGGSDGLSLPATLTFTDNAAAGIPNSGLIASGKYKPTNLAPDPDIFPAAGPYGDPSAMTNPLRQTFGGSNPNGAWILYVVNDGESGLAGNAAAVNAAGGWGLELLGPTAAGVSLSGRVVTRTGQGIRGAKLTIAGAGLAVPLTVTANSFGYYRFDGVPAGGTYIVSVSSGRVVFDEPARAVNLLDAVGGFDFTAH
jgi:hypothetical protein